MIEKLALPEIKELLQANDLATLGEVMNRWLPADLAGVLTRLPEHDQVRALAFEPALERARVVQHRDFDALTGQIVAQQIAQFDVVVDDKYLSSHEMKFNAQQEGISSSDRPQGLPGVTAKGVRNVP